MSWTDLPTNFKNLVWTGLKKYIKFDNPDQTISFEDVTEYEDTENTQMSAAVLNQITDALNQIMNGDLFYTESEIDTKLAEKASSTHNHDSVYLKLVRTALEFSTTKTYAVGDYAIYNTYLYRFTTAHSAGAWNSSHVSAVTVTDELKRKANAAELGALATKSKVDWDTDIDDIPTAFPPSSHTHDDRYYTKEETDELLDAVSADFYAKRYGVSGIGHPGNDLTRIYDAVGMVAEVGTDDASVVVTNDFDNAGPWMWKKCVGSWSVDSTTGRAKFTVNAYLGDPNFAEDGTMGDYVAVEIPVIYRYRDDTIKAVSLHQYEGWEPYSIFMRDHNPNDLVDKLYMPCYSLALKNGHAVSLPGYDPEQGHYQGLMNACRTYGDGSSLGNLPILPWAEWFSFIEDMFQIEFATQHCQSIMAGAAFLRSENADLATFVDATHILLNNYNAGRVVGEYIAIVASNVDLNSATYKASHRITGITRCDSSGNPSSSGTYSLITIEDLGRNYYNYDLTGATQYRCAARPYRNGACVSVVTPSGSPTNNTNGYYPMRYRYIENIYGNQYKTACDLFDVRIGTGDSNYTLEWYICKTPETYVPSTSSKPDAIDLAAEPFEKLGVVTPHENYVTGYIVSKLYDSVYKDVWIPKKTSGGSATTYYCDYAYLVNSPVVRACRFGGYVFYGANAGLSFLIAHNAPSYSYANYGGSLCFAQ